MAKPKQPPPLSEAQLEIMHVVWDEGEVTVGEVWEILSRRRSVARNTVQTVLTRLEERGWVRHRKRGLAYFYTAVHPREDAVAPMAEKLVDSAFGGSVEGLILTILQGRGLSKEEADRIRGMIEEAEKKQTRKKS